MLVMNLLLRGIQIQMQNLLQYLMEIVLPIIEIKNLPTQYQTSTQYTKQGATCSDRGGACVNVSSCRGKSIALFFVGSEK